GELTEIDYINGEVANIARELGYPTPLNSLMARLVHQVEKTGSFISRQEFLKKVEEAIQS
ncbi:MAG TPA: ketopantoate reductase C-terminal domain-containing protein, partial [Nitrospirota bacterium]